MAKYKIDYSSKQWLNPDTTAFIFTEIFRDYERSYATLKMADCNHIVEFDAYIVTEDKRDALVKKVDIMIKELARFNKELGELTYGG